MVNTAKVQGGDTVVVFGLGGIGLNVIQGAKLAGAARIVGVDINPGREEWGRKFGMTDFIDARGKDRAEMVAAVAALTDGGADYTFDCTGNTEVMRTALESCPPRMGNVDHHRRGGSRQGDRDAALPARHRPELARHGVRAARRAGPTCRRSSTGTWKARSRSIR